MRVIITLLTTISIGALLALDNPDRFRAASGAVIDHGRRLWAEKEVRIDGLYLLSRAEIERQLPLDRPVAWWHMHATEIQSKLSQNAWVDEATVTSCPDSWASRWGCFLVRVKERRPTFIAVVDGSPWVIDRHGSFLAPPGELQSRNFSGRLIAVKGIAGSRTAPDILRSQLSVASKLSETLEREVARRVVNLELLGQGDFAAEFEGVPFPIVFAAGEDAKISLTEQGARCSALLKQLAPRFPEVEKVDLAFNRVGVVRFKPL